MCLRHHLASNGETPQVVPDLQESTESNSQEKDKNNIPPELDLRFHKLSDEFFKQEPLPGITPEVILQPPIRRISEDARPLTAAEILAHRHLL